MDAINEVIRFHARTKEGSCMNMQTSMVNGTTSALYHKRGKKLDLAEESVNHQAKQGVADTVRKPKKPQQNKIEVSTYTDKDGNVHKTYTGTSTSIVESMKKAAQAAKKKDDVKIKKRLHYSYQKVSNQVLMAKNGLSASKAVLAARRSLADLKRKIKTAECSEDEKQAALAHANQMLRIAKKKQKNLELEELIMATIKLDQKNEKAGQAMEEVRNSLDEEMESQDPEDEMTETDMGNPDIENSDIENSDIKNFAMEGMPAAEATTSNLADGMFHSGDFIDIPDLSQMISGVSDFDFVSDLYNGMSDYEEIESLLNGDLEVSDEPFDLEESLEAMSEEMLDEMDEQMREMMDLMEVVNPHMDEEHFEKLKTKHRLEEQKALVKADMEYLKAYMKSIQGEQGTTGSASSGVTENAEAMTGMMSEVMSPEMTLSTSLGFTCSV